MTATMDDWQAEAIDLKRQGMESNEIAEAVGKSASTVRKVIARAREDGTLTDDGAHDPLDDLEPDEELAGEGDGSIEPEDEVPPSRAVDPQDGLFDKAWEDADLEAALEEREVTRAAKLAATSAHKLKDDEAKALLDKFELAVGEVARIGRFRIKKTMTAGNDVSFTTAPREQLRIAVDDGE